MIASLAIVLDAPRQIGLREVALEAISDGQLLVDVEWSAISTGTERLLWSGTMPMFPGMGYPLVPGYETVGRVAASADASFAEGERVFVPGASCFGAIRGLFGGAASRLVVPASRVVRVNDALGENAVMLALAATAHHAIAGGDLPELIVGHGAVGRLIARITRALGGSPVVWETNEARRGGAEGYDVLAPEDDARRNYRVICDVSGDPTLVDTLIGRLAHGGELVLAGFYAAPVQFAFPMAFMKEARLRVAAEWKPRDMERVLALLAAGDLSLDGLVTHRSSYREAPQAYETAFRDPACLKMILDWREWQ